MDVNEDVIIGDMKFSEIMPGSFQRGNFGEEIRNNSIVHITNSFFIQTTPVTIKQYKKFLDATKYESDYYVEVWNGDWINGPKFMNINNRNDECPVVGVSYIDTQEFINWLSKKHNKKFRLPTEAEFEYAAKFNCGCSTFCSQVSILDEKNLVRTQNQKEANGPRSIQEQLVNSANISGMNGSIWQWCEDWYDNYDPSDIINPKGPTNMPKYTLWKGKKIGPTKVIRGGSFAYPSSYSECSNRHCSSIYDRNFNLGFRLCI